MSIKQLLRNYTGADDKMVEVSKTIRDVFNVDKPDFIIFDEDFSDPYETNYSTKISAAESVVKDETIQDQSTQLSNAVESQMVLGRKKYQAAKFFIEKAFPNKPLIWHEFGYDDYDKCRTIQSRFISFLKTLHTAMLKYSTQLIAAKYTQAKIDEILAIRTALDSANSAQEQFMKERPQLTFERIEILNACWSVTSTVAKAGKIIFEDNYGKYQKYVITDVTDTPPDDGTDGSGGTPPVNPPA